MTGRLIVFEGLDASGKSTQARMLADRLGARFTFQPGEGDLGRRLRALLLDTPVAVDPVAEALLFAADKAQHVAEVIAPALAAGETVVCDRYTASTLAYQGHGRGLDLDALGSVLDLAVGGLRPDLVVLVDVDVAEGRRRRTGPPDRIEAAAVDFDERVRAGYLALARDPAWVVVDGTGTVDEVHARVVAAVTERGLA